MTAGSRLLPLAASGLAFLVVATAGVGAAAVSAAAVALGRASIASASPALGAALLAAAAGGAGYVLAREQTKAVLHREGMIAELEREFARVGADLERLERLLARVGDRVRADAETMREAVKEEQRSRDVVSRRVDRHREAIDAVEARIAELEQALGKAASLRVEVAR